MRRERMSRPSSSVPHQWADEGGERRAGRSMWAGSWGASHGARIARMIKIATSTAPVVARALCRATRWSEMGRVDMGRLLSRVTRKREFTVIFLHQGFETLQRHDLAEIDEVGLDAGASFRAHSLSEFVRRDFQCVHLRWSVGHSYLRKEFGRRRL